MLERIGEFIIDKYFNPCKKCLVQATCRPKFQKCDNYSQYLITRYRAGSSVEFWGMLLFVGAEFIFIIAICTSLLWKK